MRQELMSPELYFMLKSKSVKPQERTDLAD